MDADAYTWGTVNDVCTYSAIQSTTSISVLYYDSDSDTLRFLDVGSSSAVFASVSQDLAVFPGLGSGALPEPEAFFFFTTTPFSDDFLASFFITTGCFVSFLGAGGLAVDVDGNVGGGFDCCIRAATALLRIKTVSPQSREDILFETFHFLSIHFPPGFLFSLFLFSYRIEKHDLILLESTELVSYEMSETEPLVLGSTYQAWSFPPILPAWLPYLLLVSESNKASHQMEKGNVNTR